MADFLDRPDFNIDPTSEKNVLQPMQQPTSPLLDFLIQALAISPGEGWGGREALLGLANVRRTLDENRARHLTALAGSAPIDRMPTEVTPRRSPVGGFLQDMGILGPPSARSLTAEEEQAIRFGQQQGAKQAEALMRMKQMAEMRQLQQIELAQRISQMPVEQQRKLLGTLMGVSAEAGPAVAQQMAPSMGVSNLPAYGGQGMAQTRGIPRQPTSPTEAQVEKRQRDQFNFSTKILQDEIKSLAQEQSRTGVMFKDEKKERLKQLQIQLSQLANEWGLPPIMLPIEPTTPVSKEAELGLFGGLLRAHPAVRAVKNLGTVAGSLFGGGEQTAPPAGGGQAEAGPFAGATPTAQATRPAMTPTPIVELPAGYTIKLKSKK
jgi:hypothetical protein